jgi:mannonate dehydratase
MRVSRRNFVRAAAVASVLEGAGLERTVSAGSEAGRMRVTAFPRAVGRDPSPLSKAALRHVRQMGVRDIRIIAPWVPGYDRDGEMDLDELLRVKRRAESVGLKVGAVYLRKVDTANLLLDRPGWNRELEKISRTIVTMGKAGIPVLEHSLLLSRVIRDVFQLPLPGYRHVLEGRGGSRMYRFDGTGTEEHGRPAGSVSSDQLWERITRFQEHCIPVASEARVHVACHPDDPPSARYWGVTQALNSKEGLDRLINIVPSKYNGILLCLGTMQESGADVIDLIRYFGGKKKIFDIDFRAVRGTVPNYDEVFLDEGDLDMWKVVQVLREVDYQWTLEPDHVPGITAEGKGDLISYAWAIAYIKALIDAAYGERV